MRTKADQRCDYCGVAGCSDGTVTCLSLRSRSGIRFASSR